MATVSHELRSPVHAILGLSELLLDRDLATEDHRLVSAIHREGKALETLINDLLVLSKMVAGKLKVIVQPFAPRALVDEVISMFTALATDKGISLQARLDENVPLAIRGDRNRIRQILINLVSNAVKYTATGSVGVLVSHDSSRGAPSDTLHVRVVDTGPGIPEAAMPHLYEAFEQVHDQHQEVGTGLGLSITRRLVDLLDGVLDVETSSAGTSFALALPVLPAERRTDLLAATQSSRPGRVLVVDDSEVNRLLAQSQFERLGVEATTADGGEEALKILTEIEFDAIFMDWHMPGMDGLQTTREIQLRSGPNAPPPIVMVTADVSDGARRLCLESGASDYLPKPVSLASLAECLTKWLPVDIESVELTTDGEAERTDGAVDVAVIDQLVQDLGDPAVVTGVISTFIADAPRRLAVIAAENGSEDAADIGRAAHTLKSTAALLGASTLADACAGIEEICRTGRPPPPNHVAEIEHQLAAVLAELTSLTNSLLPAAPTEAPTKGAPA